ncbi:hypothetical protein DVK85_03415 [Flavobacterium arcticum]|uniref:Uncharacterized protein n=1 Tax=Flavobacterium arcticum TaxID=1784713 RepID=A0A345H9R8_9FLAO|nr:hypothetical protein DVK85_03415 [Flavobacterium arcticum]
MNNESNKELEFSRLQKEWRDHSVNQLSNVNNIFLGLSSGLYIYLMNIDCQTFFFPYQFFPYQFLPYQYLSFLV